MNGFLLVLGGQLLKQYTPPWPWLLWLDLEPADDNYVDYFPLIPWFCAVLIGIFIGGMLYVCNVRRRPFISVADP